MRGKEGDFFSSCKPFQLCSGLRTETGREREKREQSLGAHTERGKERRRGRRAGFAWHFVSFSEKRRRRWKAEKRGSVSWDRLQPAEQSLGWSWSWSWERCLGLCPLDTVPRLTGPGLCPPPPSSLPPLLLLPPDALFHSRLAPSETPPPAFDLLCLSGLRLEPRVRMI